MYIGGTTGGLPTQTAGLSTLGVENPRCTFRSLDDDEFTFEIKQVVTTATLLGYGEVVKLYKVVAGVSTQWFSGTISRITVEGSGETETVKYVASGPWFLLKRTMWQVASQCYAPSTGVCPLVSTLMSKVVLFQDPVSGASITTGTQISNVIAYAQTLGVGIGVGVTPAFVNVPFEETRDLTIADAIRRGDRCWASWPVNKPTL